MSAPSPAPLPCAEPDDHGAGAWSNSSGDRGRSRPALWVAPQPDTSGWDGDELAHGSVAARPVTDVVPVDRTGAARRPVGDVVLVRLVPRGEPPATPLPAVGPASVRPPGLGTPEALGRPRPLAGAADPDSLATLSTGPLPDPTRLCCAVVQAAVEGLRGARPLAQLTRWVTPEVYERLALRAELVQGAGTPRTVGRAGIRRVRVFRIGDLAAEATVVVDDGPRVRAVALRVEEHRGRWRATALEIG